MEIGNFQGGQASIIEPSPVLISREPSPVLSCLFLSTQRTVPCVIKYGENINSVVTLLECNGNKGLLVGDLNNKAFDEYNIANKINKIDLLKVGHHGYPFSSSIYMLKHLNPKYSVVCNTENKIYPHVKYKFNKLVKSKFLCTADNNGIKFDIDSLTYITNIM